jgi:hypothetical protein
MPAVVTAVALLRVLVSVFLGTLIVVAPVTRAFNVDTYLRVQRLMTDHVTPIVTAVAVLAALATAIAAWRLRRAGAAWRGPAVALACLLAVGVSSMVVSVPINHDLHAWSLTGPPPDWTAVRDRWDEFHVLRTALTVVALTAMGATMRRPVN